MINLDASLLHNFVQFVHLQELRLMAGIGTEVGYRNRDRNWVTGMGIVVGSQELRSKLVTGIGIEVGLGIGIEVGLQELRSKLVTGVETGS